MPIYYLQDFLLSVSNEPEAIELRAQKRIDYVLRNQISDNLRTCTLQSGCNTLLILPYIDKNAEQSVRKYLIQHINHRVNLI